MKNLLNLSLAIGIIGMLSYCGGTDDPAPKGDDKDTTMIDTTKVTNPLTAEENKELLQAIAIDFVGEMSSLEETTTAQTLISFGLFLEDAEPSTGGRKVSGTKGLNRINRSILAFAQQRLNPGDFARMASTVDDHEPETIQELWDEYKGVFEWNNSTEEWDYTAGGNVVKFNFPATTDGSTNNASITINSYTGVIIANPIDEEYDGDLPESLDMDLKVDGVKEMGYSFDIDYSTDGEPELIDTELFMNPFTLTVKMTNTEAVIANSVDFKNGDKLLIGTSIAINGNFDEDNILDAEDNDDPSQVIVDGSVTLTLLDFQINGKLEFKKLYDEVGELDTYWDSWSNDPETDLQANALLLEDALNKYAPLTTKYISTNTIAATAEWYTYVETYNFGNDTEKSIELGARMVFEDESKVDIEDYFASGFSQLESDLNDLIDAIGNDIGEELDNVDFD
jgi:hypothetical protein